MVLQLAEFVKRVAEVPRDLCQLDSSEIHAIMEGLGAGYLSLSQRPMRAAPAYLLPAIALERGQNLRGPEWEPLIREEVVPGCPVHRE